MKRFETEERERKKGGKRNMLILIFPNLFTQDKAVLIYMYTRTLAELKEKKINEITSTRQHIAIYAAFHLHKER